MFDFVTVLGSITDILVTEINVRAPHPPSPLYVLYPYNTAVKLISWSTDSLYSKLCENKLNRYISKENHGSGPGNLVDLEEESKYFECMCVLLTCISL